MNHERLGRALGGGARDAGRLLVRLAEAAAAPPSARTAPQPAVQSRPAAARAARPSMLAPVRRAGGVLWLEVTGSFFALLGLSAAIEAWRRHGDLAGGGHAALLAWAALLLCLMFAWFAVSSFVRARRRERA